MGKQHGHKNQSSRPRQFIKELSGRKGGITQMSRWMLGSIENEYYELLSGTFTEDYGIRLFYLVLLPINLSILLIGGNIN